MAAKFFSTQTTEFGMSEEDGMMVQSFSYDVSSDKAEVMDITGDIVQTHRFNKKASISIEGLASSSSVAVGDEMASIANTAMGQLGGTILVDSVVVSKSSDGFAKVKIAATQYDLTLTAQA
jgi:hypothetical protein